MKPIKLPEKGTPEADELIRRFKAGEELARELGYSRRDAVVRMMRSRFGISLTYVPKQKEQERYIPYPAFELKPLPVIKGSRDPEELNIVRADGHAGKKTVSYNLSTYQKRVDFLLGKVLKIAALHKPISKINVFYLGDNVQGENIYQGSKVGDTECGAYDQIHSYAVPTESRFINSCAQIAPVDVKGVVGNHGIYGREATRRTNWDNFFYKALQDANGNQKHVSITMPTKFYELVNILGYQIFLFHGDQVRATSGIPLFALKRKLQEWYAYVGGFNYAFGGHFHTWGADAVNSVADYQLCPPLVTGDEWALEVVGRASQPVQLCFGIHVRHGRTWEYKLFTDDDFLPQPTGKV